MNSDVLAFIWRAHIACIVNGTLCLLLARQSVTVKNKYMLVSVGMYQRGSGEQTGMSRVPLPMSFLFLWHFHLTSPVRSHKLRGRTACSLWLKAYLLFTHAINGKEYLHDVEDDKWSFL